MPAFDPEREEHELREYLGAAYDHSRLQDYDRQLEEELERVGDEAELYRTSEAYLYNLTAFAMTGTKQPYLDAVRRVVSPGARVLDYGCGIGSDGLALLEEGYEVCFADFDNPSTRYLRWRLEHRGFAASVHDLDRGEPEGRFDLAYAFDVIEHVADPFDFLELMERCADRVCVNFLEPEPGETCLHHDLPVGRLVARSARHPLLDYRVLHSRSHLVLYETRPAGGRERLRSRALVWRRRAGGG